MFYFRLALALGFAHPDRMLQELSSKEVAEWMAYERLEPFGSRHRDWHFGKVALTVAQCMAGDSVKNLQPRDFVHPNRMDHEQRIRKQAAMKQSGHSIKAIFQALKKLGKQENG